jgi:hypothetical protein
MSDFKFVTDDISIEAIEQPKVRSSILYNKYGDNVYTKNLYEGQSCFLILSGPSFAKLDKTLLNVPGIITAGVNNSVYSFRPNLWFSSDPPTHFIKSCWLDPKVTKYVDYLFKEERLFDNENNTFLDKYVYQCPGIFYYKKKNLFESEKYFTEDVVSWGNSAENGGKRSVMLVAIKILYYLGFKNVYLLGCDFKMDQKNPYHFSQYRHTNSVNGNNKIYETLQERFEALKEYMGDFKIFNCNPESDLKVFPYVSFEEALKKCIPEGFPGDLVKEPTDGLYDRAYNMKLDERNKKFKKVTFSYSGEDVELLEKNLVKSIEEVMSFKPKIEFIIKPSERIDKWVSENLKSYIKMNVVRYSDEVIEGAIEIDLKEIETKKVFHERQKE